WIFLAPLHAPVIFAFALHGCSGERATLKGKNARLTQVLLGDGVSSCICLTVRCRTANLPWRFEPPLQAMPPSPQQSCMAVKVHGAFTWHTLRSKGPRSLRVFVQFNVF